MIAVVLGGISYAILSDPERPAVGLFKSTLKEFSQHSKHLDVQFKTSQSLTPLNKVLSVTFMAEQHMVKMTVSSQSVTLAFDDADGHLGNKSIILEPFITESTVKWRCINGSVLVRIRTKNCRMGYGHSIGEMSRLD